jgi:hypothetical protein
VHLLFWNHLQLKGELQRLDIAVSNSGKRGQMSIAMGVIPESIKDEWLGLDHTVPFWNLGKGD